MKKYFFHILLFIFFGLLVWVYYHLNPAAQNSFFPSCPTHKFLGIYCPGCGSQRAFHYLLHGEVGKALRYNVFFVLMFPIAAVLVIQYIYEKTSGKRFRLKFFENRAVLLVFFGLVVAYFIARNLPFPELEFLRPPNYAL